MKHPSTAQQRPDIIHTAPRSHLEAVTSVVVMQMEQSAAFHIPRPLLNRQARLFHLKPAAAPNENTTTTFKFHLRQ